MGLFQVEEKSAIAGIFDKKISQDKVKKAKYTGKKTSESPQVPEAVQQESGSDQEENDSEEEVDGQERKKVKSKPASGASKPKKEKPVLDEQQKQRLTAFFGNLNSNIITDKDAFKQFKEFARQAGTVSSIRFRSIAFSELLPRKAAFILQKLHPARDAVNAYVVFKEESSVVKAVEMNGQVFLDHHVRVDSLSHPTPHFRKRSVFLGNMDFEAKEEELYRHFEACGEIEYVRIVRDAKTNVGKGFGYVQFKNADAVPLAILMSGTEFSGRPLRITHCKLKTRPSTAPTEDPSRQKHSKRQRAVKAQAGDMVIEGERAKAGHGTSLRKRKPRHRNDPTKAKKVKSSK